MKKIVLFTVVLFSAIWCKTHNKSDTQSNAKIKESSSVNTPPAVSTPIEAATAVVDASKDFANSTCDSADTQCQSLQSSAAVIANADATTIEPYMNAETLNVAASNVNTNSTTDFSISTEAELLTTTNVSENAKTNPYLGLEIALPAIVSVWIVGVAAIALKMKISSGQWGGIYKELETIQGYDRNESKLPEMIDRLSIYVSHIKTGATHFSLFEIAPYATFSVTKRTDEVLVLQLANQYLEDLLKGEDLSQKIKEAIKLEILKNKKAILAKTADQQMLIELVESAISSVRSQTELVSKWHPTSREEIPLYKAIVDADRSTVGERIMKLNLTPEQIEHGVLQVLEKQTPAQIQAMVNIRKIPGESPLHQITNLVQVHYPKFSRMISRNLVRNPEVHISGIRLTEDPSSPKILYIKRLINIAKQIQKFKH